MAGAPKRPASAYVVVGHPGALPRQGASRPESDGATTVIGLHDAVALQCRKDRLQPRSVVFVSVTEQTPGECWQIQRFAWWKAAENLYDASSPDPVGLAPVGWFCDARRN